MAVTSHSNPVAKPEETQGVFAQVTHKRREDTRVLKSRYKFSLRENKFTTCPTEPRIKDDQGKYSSFAENTYYKGLSLEGMPEDCSTYL